jgi:hypothetical protein
MSIDIDPAGLCPKCRLDHEAQEKLNGKAMPVIVTSLCIDCKRQLGLTGPKFAGEEGENTMKKGKRKYTRRAGKAIKSGKTPKLDRETKKFIKNILKSGKKAEKLEAKANKLQDRADELREKAAGMKAGIDALKKAVQDVA